MCILPRRAEDIERKSLSLHVAWSRSSSRGLQPRPQGLIGKTEKAAPERLGLEGSILAEDFLGSVFPNIEVLSLLAGAGDSAPQATLVRRAPPSAEAQESSDRRPQSHIEAVTGAAGGEEAANSAPQDLG